MRVRKKVWESGRAKRESRIEILTNHIIHVMESGNNSSRVKQFEPERTTNTVKATLAATMTNNMTDTMTATLTVTMTVTKTEIPMVTMTAKMREADVTWLSSNDFSTFSHSCQWQCGVRQYMQVRILVGRRVCHCVLSEHDYGCPPY
ncbi:unnamed protein product [Polarella glacialis]|uniref:Uncharacterized protein n=1 Tax=Polarella glacialis TaxID=89957 RepID=A0A813F7F5_POLGL|nr:unnamed protein product [Polarella glacialis]CAE8607485.1 unnamed protein product [Polarella glacialis]